MRVLDRIRRRFTNTGTRPAILLYHRIARPTVDPWGLAVTPEHFEEHVSFLRRARRPLSMSDFVSRLRRGTLSNDAVAITFDDGYADNLLQAKPQLAAFDVPATVFVTTGVVGHRAEFWWDELARAILLYAGDLDCDVVIGGEPYRIVLPRSDGEAPRSTWRAWEKPATAREETYLALWGRLRLLTAVRRAEALARLRALFNPPPVAASDLPMTKQQVAELAADGLFDIGGHTVTHPVLPALDPCERRVEILSGKLACEQLANRPVAGFAYPHGAVDAGSRAAVQECGFEWACSTEPRSVSPQHDLYALPRIGVLDCDRRGFARALGAA
jgi:peptidoglycan/xylan/chitin deacetylase (PgdA/CDA1 family)